MECCMLFRTRTKAFEKAQRYGWKNMKGGKKAELTELLENTIPKILERKKFEVPSDRTINIRCTIGLDGSGLVQCGNYGSLLSIRFYVKSNMRFKIRHLDKFKGSEF